MAVFTGNGLKTAPSFTFSSDTNTGFYRHSADSIGVAVNSQAAARFASNGTLALGIDATIRSSSGTSALAIEGSNTTSSAQASLIQNNGVAVMELGRGGGAALGSTDAVVDQTILGVFRFSGTDGSSLENAAGLTAQAEADWTTSARPSSLNLLTRGAAESAPTRKVRVSPTGSILVGSDAFGGNSPLETINLRVGRNISKHGVSAATIGYGIVADGEIQEDLDTLDAAMYTAYPRTANGSAPYTISDLIFYDAQQGSALGTDCTVDRAFAFRAGADINKATINVGFRSEIPDTIDANRSFSTIAGGAPSQFNSLVMINRLATRRVTATSDIAATLATSVVFGMGYIAGVPTTNIDYTLPTGAACDDWFQDQLPDEYGAEWSVLNNSATSNTITVVGDTGHTVTGDPVVAANSFARFLTVKTGTDTFLTARIGG